MTKYFDDKEINDGFSEDVATVAANYSAESDQRALRLMILDYAKLVPAWNYAVAKAVLTICDMEIQVSRKMLEMNTKDDGASRNDAEAVNRLINSIKLMKEQIGLDPKSLASKGDGSISEAFSEVAGRGMFDKRRFVCKTVLGLRRAEGDVDSEITNEDDAALTRYLESAKAE